VCVSSFSHKRILHDASCLFLLQHNTSTVYSRHAVYHPKSPATMNADAVVAKVEHIRASAELRYIIAVVSKACPEGETLAIEYHEILKERIRKKDNARNIMALGYIIKKLYKESKGCRKIIEALLLLPGVENQLLATGTSKIGYLQQTDLERELGIGNETDELLRGEIPKKRKLSEDWEMLMEESGGAGKHTEGTTQTVPAPAPKKLKTQSGTAKSGNFTKGKENKTQLGKCARCEKGAWKSEGVDSDEE